MTVEEFIKELKPMVKYDKDRQLHYMGSTILTNQEINVMLDMMLGDDYKTKSSRERTKIRQRIFKELIE